MTTHKSQVSNFCWSELATNDPSKVAPFYEKIFNWKAQTQDMGEYGTYTVLFAGGKDIAGIRKLGADETNVPPHWLPYVSVANLESTCEQVAGLKGEILSPPADIPGVGRFAVIRDPGRAVLALFEMKKP